MARSVLSLLFFNIRNRFSNTRLKKKKGSWGLPLYVINVNANVNVNVNAFTFVYENRKRVYVKRTCLMTFLHIFGREAPLFCIYLGASRLSGALRAHFITFLGASRPFYSIFGASRLFWALRAHFITFLGASRLSGARSTPYNAFLVS